MVALWARNKFGWDRPGQTMTFRVPDQNGDIGDEPIAVFRAQGRLRQLSATSGHPPSRDARETVVVWTGITSVGGKS